MDKRKEAGVDRPDELRDKVIEWLSKEGYPLEMQVAQTFLKSGFRVIQSEYYEDPETKTPREIDVIAHIQDDVAQCLFRVSVCTECKVTKAKPWILLTSAEASLAAPAQVAQRAGSATARRFLSHVARRKEYQNLSLFQLPQRPAYGLLQTLSSGNDLSYSACMSVAKATAATTKEADIADKTQFRCLEIVIPAIVIDGRLFESFIDKNGEMVVNEVPEGTLVWRNMLVRAPHTIIRIITLPHLPQFIKDVCDAAELLFGSEDEVRQILPVGKISAGE